MSDDDKKTITVVGAAILLALKRWTAWLFVWIGGITAAGTMLDSSPFFRDDTDAGGWFAPRSHLRPSIDALTGCQFLRSSSGSVVPRMDGRGRQIGCKERP